MRNHILHQHSLPLRAELYFAGVNCTLSTNSPDVLASLLRWKETRVDVERGLALNVVVDPLSKRSENAPMHFRGLRHLVFAIFSPGEFFVFDLLRRTINGVVSIETARDESFWTSRIVPLTLGLMGITVGVFPIHCACLDFDGEGTLIAGTSKSGKSTLAAALSRMGYALVSDGWTYFTRDGGDLTAYGIGAPVKLLPDSVSFFPELLGQKPVKSFNGEMAIEVDALQAWDASVRTQTRPRVLVLLERFPQRACTMEPLGNEAVFDFFSGSVELLPPPLEHLAAARSALMADLSRIDCWKLRYGGPPDEAARMIHRLCEGSECVGPRDGALS
jgi:hypothetical protein